MNEFDFKHGQVKAGFIAILASAAIFVLAPFLLIALIPGEGLADFPAQLANLVLMLGLPVTVTSFFRGFYHKGTRSRLASGVAESLMTSLYFFVVFTSAPFVQLLPQGEVANSLPILLVVLGALWQCLRMIRNLDDYLSNRLLWLKEQGIEPSKVSRPPRAGLAEFHLDQGDPHLAWEKARKLTYTLSVIPALVTLFIWLLLQGSGAGETPIPSVLLHALYSIAWTMILFGYALALLGWFIGLYAKGTVSRLTFGLVLFVILAFYAWAIAIFSRLESGLDGVSLHTEMGMVLLMALMVVATVALGYLGEFVDNRRLWKKKVGLPIQEKALNPDLAVMEVHPRTGSFERGVKGARYAMLAFMVIPVILLVLLVPFMARSEDGTVVSFAEILAMEVQTILLWGLPLVIFGFVREFYPLGSLGRMCFGLAKSLFLALYLYALLLDGALETWLSGQLPLDLDQVWLFLMVPLAFYAALHVAEMRDHRRAWKVSIGRKVPEAVVEEERHPLLLDFRPRYGRYVSGTKEAGKAGRRYLVTPAIMVLIINALMQQMSESSGIEQLSEFTGSLGTVYNALLIFALPIIILTFFRGFYPKGSFSRLAFGCVVAVLLALWVWALSQGGKVAMDLGVEGRSLGFELDVSGLILLFAVVELLWAGYYLAEYLSYRKSWIANGYHPVDDKAPKAGEVKVMAPTPDQAGQ